MNIYIKYCGGCNPRYNRSKILERLQEEFKDIKIVTKQDINIMYDFVVILSGCMACCVEHRNLEGKYGKMMLRNLEEYQDLKSKLEELIKQKDMLGNELEY